MERSPATIRGEATPWSGRRRRLRRPTTSQRFRRCEASCPCATCARQARFRQSLNRLRSPRSLVIVLAGEWVPAWLAMSVTFLVALIGVAGRGWWVLRGDARNRASEDFTEAEPHDGNV